MRGRETDKDNAWRYPNHYFFLLSFFWQEATFKTIVGKNGKCYHYIVVITTILLIFFKFPLPFSLVAHVNESWFAAGLHLVSQSYSASE